MKNIEKIDKIIFVISMLYLIIPITLQLFFWFNRIISIPLILLLWIGGYKLVKNFKCITKETAKSIFNKKNIIFFLVLIVLLNILSGAGGIFYQNWDYHGRNAIFHDLINNRWPVRYDYSSLNYESGIFGTRAILNYYFAYWLPGALIGKIFGFKIASLFMLLWQTLGVIIFFYYVIRYMKKIKLRYFFIFIAFGGINAIGYFIINALSGKYLIPIGVTHIDTSMGVFCMSSFVTQLFWVFNQSLPTWIITMLYLQEKDYKTCGYYFALLVPFAPFPMLGLLYVIICHILFGKDLKSLITKERFKSLFTIPNIFGCLSILPIVFMYTLNESPKGLWFIEAYQNGTLGNTILNYILFILLEFLVYIVILNKDNNRQIIMCFLFFTIAPLFFIGGADLGNRSTIPLLIIMYLLTIKYLDNLKTHDKKNYIKQKILIVILIIASITNYNEFYRSINYTYQNKKNNYSNVSDSYKTFSTFENKECSIFITNFVAKDNKNNKILQFILRD